MTKKFFWYWLTACVLTMTVLYSNGSFGKDYPPSFNYGQVPDVPLEELGPKYHFLDKLEPSGITHMSILESNSDAGTHTINFFPELSLGKSEMQSVHLTACVISTYFDGFTLRGTAFYLPNGLLFGSLCIRPDGKGMQKGKWGGEVLIDLEAG